MADNLFVPNIGPGERRKRLLGGVVGLVVAVAALALLVAFSVDRWWRLALIPPFWMGGIGFFQYREKT
ncbi:MAG: hypothetical protein P8Z36_01440 [Gemmatimonadota bacterium]